MQKAEGEGFESDCPSTVYPIDQISLNRKNIYPPKFFVVKLFKKKRGLRSKVQGKPINRIPCTLNRPREGA